MVFYFSSGRSLVLKTPNDYTYNHGWVSVEGGTSVVLWVMACNDAHIALSTVGGDSQNNTYEIVIGQLQLRAYY